MNNLPKLKCIEPSQANVIFGDFQALNSQFLSIFHASCDIIDVATCQKDSAVT